MLGRGAQIMDGLFPGLLGELDAGSPVAHSYDEVHLEFAGHLFYQGKEPLARPLYLQSRPYLENKLRARLMTAAEVALLEGYDVVGPVADPGRVVGARVADRAGQERMLAADLVVDSTGRAGRCVGWLTELGYPTPTEAKIAVDVGYTTRLLRMPTDALGGKLFVLRGAVPGRARTYVLSALEGGHWMESVAGFGPANHAPRDPAGFENFVMGLRLPQTAAALAAAEAVGEVSVHRFPANVRRRYERLTRFPDGLVVLGDAVCSYNPVYGQGMTVAAVQALALRKALAAGTADLPRRYFAGAAKPVDTAWRFAAGGDLALPEVPGPRPVAVRVSNRLVQRVLQAAGTDRVVAERFGLVVNLIDPPAALLRPDTLRRVVLGARAGTPGPQQRAAGTDRAGTAGAPAGSAPIAAAGAPPAPPAVAAVSALLSGLRRPLVDLLAAVSDPAAAAPGLEWSVGEVGAHLVVGTELYLRILRGEGSGYTSLAGPDVAAASRESLLAVPDRSGPVLAARMASLLDELETELARGPALENVRWHAGIEMPRACVAALLLAEYAIHGRDIARALNRPWRIDPNLAPVVLPAAALVLPLLVDPVAAAGFTAAYRLHLRGQADYYLLFHDGTLNLVTERPDRIDCTISIDPVTYLLSAYGRVGPVRPALTGKALIYGPKPWLGLKFDSLVRRP